MVRLMAKQNVNLARTLWVFLGVFVGIGGLLLLLGMGGRPASHEPLKVQNITIRTASGNSLMFMVEVADTPESMETGLMFRDHLDENRGMLFIYPEDQDSAMWMKNTRIPLDMLFIQANGTISHIHEGALPFDETPIPSGGPVKATLELKGGVVKKMGIVEGDRVEYPLFSLK